MILITRLLSKDRTVVLTVLRAKKRLSFWIDFSVLVGLIVFAFAAWQVWGWGCVWRWLTEEESNSAAIRNVGLIVAGALGLRIAVWRSRVAEKQVETARRGLLNERYQKGAEMFGDSRLSVRLGGIYALRRLANEAPEEYHLEIVNLFSSFVRRPGNFDGLELEGVIDAQTTSDPIDPLRLRQDVQDVMVAVCTRSDQGKALEQRDRDFILDLNGAQLRGLNMRSSGSVDISGALMNRVDLNGVWLGGANLSKVICRRGGDFGDTIFFGANLSEAVLSNSNFVSARFVGTNEQITNLSGVNFSCSDLTDAKMWNTDLTGVRFDGANISGVKFSKDGVLAANGLTSTSFIEAVIKRSNPPDVRGVIDENTNQQLAYDRELVKWID